jgi:hypothetical protein
MLAKLKNVHGIKRTALIILATATIIWMLVALWIAVPSLLNHPVSAAADQSWYVENLVKSVLLVSTAYAGSALVMGFVCVFLWKALRRY